MYPQRETAISTESTFAVVHAAKVNFVKMEVSLYGYIDIV